MKFLVSNVIEIFYLYRLNKYRINTTFHIEFSNVIKIFYLYRLNKNWINTTFHFEFYNVIVIFYLYRLSRANLTDIFIKIVFCFYIFLMIVIWFWLKFWLFYHLSRATLTKKVSEILIFLHITYGHHSKLCLAKNPIF